MTGASSVLFRIRLIQLKDFLKTNCPGIWETYGPGLESSNAIARFNRLRRLPFEYESDNELVNLKLRSLVRIYRSQTIGLLVVFLGVLIEIFGPFDA